MSDKEDLPQAFQKTEDHLEMSPLPHDRAYGDESAPPEESSAGPEISEKQSRKRLMEELDALAERLKAARPDYSPPPFSAQGLVDLIEKDLENFTPEAARALIERLRSTISEDLLDVDTWKGIWYVLNYSLESQADFLKRRVRGEYETDEWGLDSEMVGLVEPFFNFMYKTYWRVETSGMENVPDEGRAMLVCNHSGQLPWDGAMLGASIYNEHPARRFVRTLYATWFPMLPYFSMMLTKLGQVLANEENGIRLLEQEHLVAVFPEGYKGAGKLYRDRYKLARFGGGGFVRMALKTGSPMIPVSIVGAEETYISLVQVPWIARLIHFPYFSISPTFPWLGLLGLVPIPTKWYIDFGEPIQTGDYGAGAADNLVLVSQLTDQVRNIVQQMLYTRLEKRQSVLFG